MIRRILVGLGGRPCSSACIAAAVDLAVRHKAELTAVAILNLKRLANVGPVPLGGGAAAEELRQHRITLARGRAEEAMEELLAACRDSGVTCDVQCEEREAPIDCLVAQARYHDLVVLGLRNIFEYGVIGEAHEEPGSFLSRLIGEGVRPIIALGAQPPDVRRVLIAYSGSMESAKTMRRFLQLRPWPDIVVRIVTFAHPHGSAEQLLRDAAHYCETHGLEVTTAFVDAPPREKLLEEAGAWDADLIVLGNSARSLLLRRVFGETALHVITNSDRPLFLGQ